MQAVHTSSATYPSSTVADLYNPLAMPPALAAAHAALDRAVDKCYRPAPFPSDRARVEFLFALYEALTAPSPRPPNPLGKNGPLEGRRELTPA